MTADKYEKIKTLLNSGESEEIHKGLVLIREELPNITEDSARSLFEMVSALFYIDLLDHPEHAYVLDEAVGLVADFGDFVVPILLDNLDAGDMKAQLTIGAFIYFAFELHVELGGLRLHGRDDILGQRCRFVG